MSNVHRFKPQPKAPPPRKRLPWGRAAWLPWVLVLASAIVLTVIRVGDIGTFVAAVLVLVVVIGGWLEQRS